MSTGAWWAGGGRARGGHPRTGAAGERSTRSGEVLLRRHGGLGLLQLPVKFGGHRSSVAGRRGRGVGAAT